MELLLESTDDLLVESVVEEDKKKLYIEGVTLQAEITNGNKRVYPAKVLKEAIQKHTDIDMKRNRCVGQLNHPLERTAEIDTELVSHVFESVRQEGNNFITRARVLENMPKGKILASLLENNIKMGISSRGLGSVSESNGKKIVQEFNIISLGDAVFMPSAPEGFIEAIKEQQEWIYDNGTIVQKDLSEEMDEYKKLINECKAKDIQEVMKNILTDYIKKLTL
jgi:hypothetical protein